MIRPEIQKFLNYIDRNIDSFKISDIPGKYASVVGITNRIYTISFFYIQKGKSEISLSNDEGLEVSKRIQKINERDFKKPKEIKEKNFLKELGSL